MLRDSFSSKTCAAFKTRELPSEHAARGRRKAAMALKSTSYGPTTDGSNDTGTSRMKKPGHRKPQMFNLSTYKIHSLGDYTNAIHMFGTTNSYNMQVVGKSSLFQVSLTNRNDQDEFEHR